MIILTTYLYQPIAASLVSLKKAIAQKQEQEQEQELASSRAKSRPREIN
jgi:hypothetical protein